jgi:dienelactone hydrolase
MSTRSARRLAALTAVLVIAVLALPRLPPIRTIVLTAALVPEMIQLGPAPLSMAAPPPGRETVYYGTPLDRMDIYLPAGAARASSRPAVVLALGVHPQPIDHPDITSLATAMSRAGVVVGVPDSTDLRNLRVTPAEPGHLADALLTIASLPEVNAGRVGLAGFSAGASIALLAAAEPHIAARVRYVSAFGGYADAERLLVDVATRTSLTDGQTIAWQPDAGIRRDVLELALATLDSDSARDYLRARLTPIVSATERARSRATSTISAATPAQCTCFSRRPIDRQPPKPSRLSARTSGTIWRASRRSPLQAISGHPCSSSTAHRIRPSLLLTRRCWRRRSATRS